MPNQHHSTKKKKLKFLQKQQIWTKKGNSVYPTPHTKMEQCPQCAHKYNTRGKVQVRQNVRERSPKLGWQTLNLKNKKNQKDNKNNEGYLPQALSLMSSARLVI
jgi:hypothetical protein